MDGEVSLILTNIAENPSKAAPIDKLINPFKIVEEEELKLVKGLVKCLSKERAEDYGKWFDVALCLHNINESLLEDWKEFSSQASSYNPDECDQKWNSIHSNHSGERLGIGSLMFWAKNDNEELFNMIGKRFKWDD